MSAPSGVLPTRSKSSACSETSVRSSIVCSASARLAGRRRRNHRTSNWCDADGACERSVWSRLTEPRSANCSYHDFSFFRQTTFLRDVGATTFEYRNWPPLKALVLGKRCEDAGTTLVLEPLNVIVDHQGYYLDTSAEGFQIVDAQAHPAHP